MPFEKDILSRALGRIGFCSTSISRVAIHSGHDSHRRATDSERSKSPIDT